MKLIFDWQHYWRKKYVSTYIWWLINHPVYMNIVQLEDIIILLLLKATSDTEKNLSVVHLYL